jgi:hypothetical protein
MGVGSHYIGGEVLKQFGDDGTFHQVSEIDQVRLKEVRVVPTAGGKPIILQWKPGRVLVHFYRVIHIMTGTQDASIVRLYCVGYEDGNCRVVVTIAPDDSIAISDEVVW